MLKLLAPYLTQIVIEVGRDAAIEAIRQRRPPAPHQTAVLVSPLPTEHATHCPYCTTAKLLAAIYLYLKRAEQKPELTSIYLQLSRRLAIEALEALEHGDGPSHGGLIRAIKQISAQLAIVNSKGSLAMLVDDVWATALLALDMAEYVNTGQIIDADVREIGEPNGH